MLTATVARYDPAYGLTTLSVEGGTIIATGQYGAPGTPQRVRVVASDVSLARQPPGPSTILNTLAARVAGADPQDAAQVNVVVRLGPAGLGARLLARVTRKSWEALGTRPGDLVHVQVKSVALVSAGGTALGRTVGPPSSSTRRQQAAATSDSGSSHEDQRAQPLKLARNP